VLFFVVVMYSLVSIGQVIGWEGCVSCTSQETGCEDCFWRYPDVLQLYSPRS